MTTIWRPRCSRGHYLASKDVHTTLGPEDWDDTCRCKTNPQQYQPSTETFGHKPVMWAGRTCCARCSTASTRTADDIDGAPDTQPLSDRSVLWPCTSAIVLGLAVA